MKHIASGSSRRYVLFNEINVTPFVDVMLVLLIIFMVTAPMMQQSLEISLPQTKSTNAIMTKEPFILKLKKDKKIYIGSSFVELNQLSDKLEALFEHKKSRIVYLQADKSVPYGFVAQTLVEIKSSGISNISLVTTTK